ncbi:MAG: hypothetical protein ACOY5U_07865 [Pseudomonadota bacterium]
MRCIPLVLGLAAGAAHAEGAARVFDCTVLQDCDAAGLCTGSGTPVRFRLEPRQLADDGSGLFTLDAGSGPVEARGLGDAGPWLWSEAPGAADALLLSDATRALWHHRGADGSARIRFLACEVTQ